MNCTRPTCIVLLLCLSTIATSAQAPEGIPRDLARQRAQQIKDVHYRLAYNLWPKADSIVGHEVLRFVQNADDLGSWRPFHAANLMAKEAICSSEHLRDKTHP